MVQKHSGYDLQGEIQLSGVTSQIGQVIKGQGAGNAPVWGFDDYGISFLGTVTGIAGAPNFQCSGLAGFGDEFFKGYWAYVVWDAGALGGAPQGEILQCTGYSSATGDFTVAAYTVPIAVGDKVLLLHPNAASTTAARLSELDAANLPADIDELKASKGRQLFSMDFWSDPLEEIVVTNAQVTTVLSSVTVEDLPATATIVRAILMFKFRMVENTNAAENSLDCTAVQPIQVDDSVPTGYVTAIDFVDEMFKIAATTREGGDVIIGDNDIAARVDGNDTYTIQWLNRIAHLENIQFNDCQFGLRIWYSV